MDWKQEARKFVHYMERVGEEKLKYEDGKLRSPGCDGDYQRCSQEIDLDRLAQVLKDAFSAQTLGVDAGSVQVNVESGR